MSFARFGRMADSGAILRGALMSGTALACAALQPAPATAQPADDLRLEEIVVTATKRGAQRLQDVPISVTAFSNDDLNNFLATEFSDIALQVPGLNFQDLGPGDKEYVIRGINSTGQATVGVYYGEAVITGRNIQDGGGRQADIELHDLERVEVLKGPQGTLYGANSLSGTIIFVPNSPDPEGFDFSANARFNDQAEGGFSWHVDGMFNVPIIEDELAIRGVGWQTEDSGFIDNVRLGREDINENRVEGGRIAARWEPTANFYIEASALVQTRRVDGESRVRDSLQPFYEQNLIDDEGLAVLQGLGGVPELGEFTNDSFTRTNWNEDINLFGVTAEYTTGFGSFLGTVNHFSRDIAFNFDSTPILLAFDAPAAAITNQPQNRDVLTAEGRFSSDFTGPLNFVVGGFVQREEKDFEVRVLASNPLGEPIGPFEGDRDFFLDADQEPQPASIFGRVQQDDPFNQFAIFGEATYDVTEDLSLLVGGRYFEYTIETFGTQTKPFFGFGGDIAPVDTTASGDDFSFKVNLSYDVTEDIMTYFTVAEGFRPGGNNNPNFTPEGSTPVTPFEPDELINYEVGLKSQWLNGRVTFNAAAYWIEWDDIQIETVDPSGAFPGIFNAGDAQIRGGEWEVSLRPLQGLDIFFGGSVTDTELESIDPQVAFARVGDEIPQVPTLQLNSTAQYTRPVTETLDGFLRAEFSWRGSSDTGFNDDDPSNVSLSPFHTLNLQGGVQAGNWSARVFARNVTDTRGELDAVNTTQDPLFFIVTRPRQVGFAVSYQF